MFSIKEIQNMNYNEQIAIIGETNRPPGGIRTVIDFINNNNITKDTKILEIGTSTGFTAIELALRTDAQITSIDINPNSIEIAKTRAKSLGIENRIEFLVADAMNLPFENQKFDIIFSGNIISYIPDRDKALSEYMRVLKKFGILFASPMYYFEKPAKFFIEKLRNALKMDISIDYEQTWENLFSKEGLELILEEQFKFDYISDSDIVKYVEDILLSNKDYLSLYNFEDGALKEFIKLYEENIFLFRDNLFKMGYSQLYFRKNYEPFDRELFTSTRIGG